MGQNSSRHQPRHSEGHSADDAHDLRSTLHTTSTTAPLSVEGESKRTGNNVEVDPSSPLRQTRRSLLRRSFLSLTKSPSPSSSREGSLAGSISNKRSWLNPRRWSRAPSNVAEEFPYPDHPDGQSNASLNVKGKEREEYDDTGVHDVQSNVSADQQPDSNSFLSSQFVTPSSTSNDKPELAELFEGSPGAADERSTSVSSFAAATQQENSSQQYLTAPGIADPPFMDKQDSLPSPAPAPSDESMEATVNDSATTSTIDASPISGDVTSISNEAPGGNAPTATPARPFPPPGTLVVVQGVVHTTDVPRSSVQNANANGDGIDRNVIYPSRSASQERIGSSARSRLSTLLHPRSVGTAPGVPDLSPEDDAAQSMQNNQQPDNVDSSLGEAATVSGSSAYASRDLSNQPITSPGNEVAAVDNDLSPPTISHEGEWNEAHEYAPSGDAEQGVGQRNSEDSNSGPISSSSIDVLGTLLSVAAAATAASLLTGSSEPILPSNHSANPSSDSARTTNTPVNTDFSVAGRAERMRNAWTSIRERLGIRSSGSSNSNTNPSSTGAGTAAQSAAEAREMMLGEMARAFSVGLGLGAFAGPASTNNGLLGRPAEVTPSAETRTLPIEGSFERFLMDLQADLRIALTTGEGGNGVRAMAAGSGWSDTPSSSETQEQSEGDIAPGQTGGDVAPIEIPESRDNVDQQREENSDISELHEVGDSEDEPVASMGPAPETTGADIDGSGGDGRQRLNGPGRINWWRLYRFPPIGVPRSNSAASAAAAAALSTDSSEASSGAPAPLPMQSTESLGAGAAASASPTPSDTATHVPNTPNVGDYATNGQNPNVPAHSTVVPVIIVGLQSVHMEWRPELNANHEHEHYHHHHHEATDDFADDRTDDVFVPTPDRDASLDREAQESDVARSVMDATTEATDDEANQRRGRRWRSRAADALRNLRSRRGGDQRNGARNTDMGAPHLAHQMPPMSPGSRMFLIYVIGGYYPPNHSIVLGNPTDLESFEALSELADLLGQVKPPTATKEEIEKSGLQVIRASNIGEHEWEGKISGNCTERCLICLDDYNPEDDVRLMSCRHAFHKDCVDRWLQTGKNNCPACRTRGVSTETRGPFVS
ncbi:hypothetical protein AX15_001280 [Amanita polypyramis BW_CC]|nr:hypothetical protein AX15_001280 [Amanita polypyramis BW_CC]